MIAPCEDRVKRLPLALKAEENARVSWQSLYKILRTDKIHPITHRLPSTWIIYMILYYLPFDTTTNCLHNKFYFFFLFFTLLFIRVKIGTRC